MRSRFVLCSNIACGADCKAVDTKDQLAEFKIRAIASLCNVTVTVKHYYISEYKVKLTIHKQWGRIQDFEVPKIRKNVGKERRNYYLPPL